LHYQFEAIHPFTDGNGRTGRVLNVLYLSLMNLLDEPILYLSKYINEHKSDYYRLLREVTEKSNFEDWILFILKAITETSIFTLYKVNAINDLFQRTLEIARTKLPSIYSYELIEILFHQPYCKIAFLVEAGVASRNTAGKYLSELEEIGILAMEKSGTESLYLNKELFKILSES
jgi:Fic family protein